MHTHIVSYLDYSSDITAQGTHSSPGNSGGPVMLSYQLCHSVLWPVQWWQNVLCRFWSPCLLRGISPPLNTSEWLGSVCLSFMGVRLKSGWGRSTEPTGRDVRLLSFGDSVFPILPWCPSPWVSAVKFPPSKLGLQRAGAPWRRIVYHLIAFLLSVCSCGTQG